MKATKQSVSLPAEMDAWITSEMKRSRRTRSSLIQEAIELMMESKIAEASRLREDPASYGQSPAEKPPPGLPQSSD